MITQIGKSMEDIAGKVTAQSERAVNSVEQAAQRLEHEISPAAEQLREFASDGVDRLSVTIRRNPLASTAIAAGVGFFLAALARR